MCATPTYNWPTASSSPVADVSIADFTVYPATLVRRPLIDGAGDLPALTRWAATLAARPGVQRGMQAAT